MIKISDLKFVKDYEKIYSENDVEPLVASIKRAGQIAPIIIDENNVVLSGNRRVAAALELKRKVIWYVRITKDTSVSEIEYLFFSNNHRVPTNVELFNILTILETVFPSCQGERTDLLETLEEKETRMEKLAREAGIKPCRARKILKIGKYNIELLKTIDEGGSNLDNTDKFVTIEIDRKAANEKIQKELPILRKSVKNFKPEVINASCAELENFPDERVQTFIFSPPYFLQRDYHNNKEEVENELGHEKTVDEYLDNLVKIITPCFNKLKDDGCLFINIADTQIDYSLEGIPQRLAQRIKALGFFWRNEIIWEKINGMYKGNASNFTLATERILMFSKNRQYKYRSVTIPKKDTTKIIKKNSSYSYRGQDDKPRNPSLSNLNKEDKNMRDYWDIAAINTASCNQKSDYLPKGTYHPAPFPLEIPKILIAKTTDPGDIVCDIFAGSGTTAEACEILGRKFIGFEIVKEFAEMAEYRLLKCHLELQKGKETDNCTQKSTNLILPFENGEIKPAVIKEKRTNQSVFLAVGASNHSKNERHPEDYYATDPIAAEVLINLEEFSPKIWECACGAGHLSKVLEQAGYNVKSTDLIDRGFGQSGIDFLSPIITSWDGDIITNPPYKYAPEFVKKALEIVPEGHKVAMFLKTLYLEGLRHLTLFKSQPPKIVYISSRRILCAKDGDFEKMIKSGGSVISYSWFIWEKGYKGKTEVEWFDYTDYIDNAVKQVA